MAKITYLVLHLGIGGVEKAIANQANILCRQHEVEIISAYRLYDTPPFKIDPRVKITYLLTDLKPNKDQLRAALKEKKPLAFFRQALISVKVLWQRKAKMRQAVRGLTSDVIISTRYLYNRLLVNHRPSDSVIIAQEHRHHNGDQTYIKKLVRSVKGMDYFMPVSAALTHFYAGLLKDDPVRCVYIPHNLDYWPQTPAKKGNVRFVSVGRLSKEKGYNDLIEIFSLIHQKMPACTLDIIGDGDQREQIEALIRTHALENQVVLHGCRDKAYVNDILARSSVYLMASYEESFGIVLIEAQSFGLPCVAFASAEGAREIITDGVNGYLIEHRDFALFAQKALALITDTALNTALGLKARGNAKKYTQEQVAKQWLNFYEQILK